MIIYYHWTGQDAIVHGHYYIPATGYRAPDPDPILEFYADHGLLTKEYNEHAFFVVSSQLDRDALTNIEEGDECLTTDTNTLYVWDGTQWIAVGSGGGPGSLLVRELDGSPSGNNISILTFNSDYTSNTVTIVGNEAIIGAPAGPPPLTTITLSGAIQYTGRLSQSNINYETGFGAGSQVDYIQNDWSYTLTTQPDSNLGDKGVLKLYINGSLEAAIDLENNFNEANRSGSQNLTDYDTDYMEGATLYQLDDGRCDFTLNYSGYGYLELIKVQWYNNFPSYQTWQARIVVTGILRQGYNEIYLVHDGITTPQESNHFKVFIDTDTGADPSVNTPTVSEGVKQSKYLSGVEFYGAGSIFYVNVVGHDCFDNVYHYTNAPLVVSGWPGVSTTIPYTDPAVSGVSSPPDIGETMTVTNWDFTQPANYFSDDARLTITPRDPYGNYTPQTSPSGRWLINSYGDISDYTHEYFRDEQFRLLDGSWDSPPANRTGNWDSTQSLLTYDGGNVHAQCYDSLVYPTIDFSTGYRPLGNPNYSLFTGTTPPSFSSFSGNVAKYIRMFYDDNVNHTNGILRLNGITNNDIINGTIEVYIKVPGKIGWTTLNKNYNGATYTGADGDGCRINPDTYNGPDFQFTLDVNNTDASTDWGIVVMILINSSSPVLQDMSIIDW